MNKESVLILSPFFFPEPISTGKYNTLLASSLNDEGFDVDVLCCHPLYPKWVVEKTVVQLKGTNAIRGGGWLRFPSNTYLRRAILEVWYLLFVFNKLVVRKGKYSHVIVIFPPSLFMMCVPFFVKKAKLIGIVHDLQGIYAGNESNTVKKIIFRLIKRVEKVSFNSCDKLIFLSEDMKRVAENVYDLDAVRNVVRYPFVTIDKFVNNSKLSGTIADGQNTIVYSGALGEKQAPLKLASFMSAFVSKNSDFKAYIFSQGPEYEILRKEFSNISFFPLVDESDLPELLLRSTIQVLPQESGTSDGSLPSKLPNLLASECKILCITDPGSELVRILNGYSLSTVSHVWDNESLIDEAEMLLKSKKVEKDNNLLKRFTKQALIKTIIH